MYLSFAPQLVLIFFPFTAKPKATQEEIEKDIEEGNVDVFRAQILDGKHAAAKDALAFVENRFKDIQRCVRAACVPGARYNY